MALLTVPAGFLLAVLAGHHYLIVPFVLICVIYGWVWLRFRPSAFVIHSETLEVVWPLKRRQVPLRNIMSLRTIDAQALKTEIGWGARVGAGGLWGGFGWLWTRRRGIVQMYVSRTDEFVWIERGDERPWLITPERPDEFIRELSRTLDLIAKPENSKKIIT